MEHLTIEGINTDIYVEYDIEYRKDNFDAHNLVGVLQAYHCEEPYPVITYVEMRYFDKNDELCNTVDITGQVCYDYLIDKIEETL